MLRWAGLAAVSVVACFGCSSGSPGPVTARGSVTVSEPIVSGAVTGTPAVASFGRGFDSCTGSPRDALPDDYSQTVPGKFRKITPGATVTVRDASGKIVGLGKLGTAPTRIRYDDHTVKLVSSLPQGGGHPEEWTGHIFCALPFKVAKVTGGSKFYTVKVANLDAVTIPARALGTISMSLGL
jgi:hypothetical protein